MFEADVYLSWGTAKIRQKVCQRCWESPSSGLTERLNQMPTKRVSVLGQRVRTVPPRQPAGRGRGRRACAGSGDRSAREDPKRPRVAGVVSLGRPVGVGGLAPTRSVAAQFELTSVMNSFKSLMC